MVAAMKTSPTAKTVRPAGDVSVLPSAHLSDNTYGGRIRVDCGLPCGHATQGWLSFGVQ